MNANKKPAPPIAMAIRKANAVILCGGALACLMGAAARGQVTGTWNSTAASGAWTAASNWTGGVAPGGADDTAVFDNSITTGIKTAALSAVTTATLGTLSFQGSNGTASGAVTGGRLFFKSTSGTSAINFNGSHASVTISSTINLANDLRINAAGALATTATLSGLVNANGNTIDIRLDNAGATLVFAGGITGEGAELIKSGDGLLMIRAKAATHTGATTLLSGTTSLNIARAIAGSTSVFIGADATLLTAAATQTINNLSGAGVLKGTGAITFANSGNTAFAGSITEGSLVKTGAGSLTLGGTNTFTGAASVNGGTLAIAQTGTVKTTAVTIGATAADSGAVEMSGSSEWRATGSITAGAAGSGALVISENARFITSSGTGFIGAGALGSGSVSVRDSGTWTMTGALIVAGGSASTGRLDISGSAAVATSGINASGAAIIGNAVGSDGAVALRDGAFWKTGNITVGHSGTGGLDISGAGKVTGSGLGYIGFGATGAGRVSVSGSGEWSTAASTALIIGNEGRGTLEISDAGKVISSGAVNMGVRPGAASGGNAIVGGDAGEWTMGGVLTIGSGTLEIKEGGAVRQTAGDMSILGSQANKTAAAIVSGSGAWINNGLNMGNVASGTATLAISDNGSISTTGAVFLGNAAGGNASATVADSGTWSITSTLEVGRSGTGRLEISGSGKVATSGASYIGRLGATGFGVVSVNGPGAEWTTGGALSMGSGTLEILNGAAVRQTGGAVNTIGYAAGSTKIANVIVSGSGAWINNGLTLASVAGASATLDVSGNGSVTSDGNIIIGNVAGGKASVTVSDSGAITTSGSVIIGGSGAAHGVVTLSGNGALETAAIVKGDAGASGTLAFDGGILRATGDNDNFIGDTLVVTIGGGGALIDSNGHDIATSATLTGAGGLAKKGPGSLTLNTTASLGSVDVAAGALSHAHDGVFTTAGGYAISNNAASILGANAHLDVGGAFTQSGTLSVLSSIAGRPAIIAQSATINAATAWLSISNISQLTGVFIQTTGGAITGGYDPDRMTLGGIDVIDGLPGYIASINPKTSDDGTELTLGGVLSWYDTNPSAAHGTFDIAGDNVDVDTVLADNPSATNPAWDGKTLTKDGAGTLTLSAANTYTGSTVINAGVILGGAADVIASSNALVIGTGGTFATGNHTQTVRHLAGAGVVDLGNSGVLNATNDLRDTAFDGAFTGLGGSVLEKTGANQLTITTGGTIGRIRVREGNLALTGALAYAGEGNNDDTGDTNSVIGHSDSGTMSITNGGRYVAAGSGNFNHRVVVGLNAGGDGHLLVSGSDSLLQAGYLAQPRNNSLVIGSNHGKGTVRVENGAQIRTGWLNIGAGQTDSDGLLVVTGSGSRLVNHLSMYVGNEGTGEMQILDGAKAYIINTTPTTNNESRLFIGNKAGGKGTLTIDGKGSLLDAYSSSGYHYVGHEGEGVLNVTNGAVFTATSGSAPRHYLEIASKANSRGTVNIDSGTIIIGNFIYLGNGSNSYATLNISNNGHLKSGDTTFVGYVGYSNATINVSSGGVIETKSLYRASGTVSVNFDGGILRNTGTASAIIINAYYKLGEINLDAGGLTLDSNGQFTTIAAALSGTGGFTKIGEGTGNFNTVAQAYTGATEVRVGVLNLAIADAIASSTAVIVSATLAGGRPQTLKNLSGATTGRIDTTASSLTGDLTLDNSEATHYAGIITGNGAITKTGAGTLTLSGSNSYTGNTTITAGALNLRGYIASATTAVNAGGNLIGTGTLAGLVTLASSATLSPGDLADAGTLTILKNLSLANGSILHFKLGTPDVADTPDGTSDLITITDDLSITGTVSLRVTAQTGFGLGVYRLINYGGTLALNDDGDISFDSLTGSSLLTDDFIVDLSVDHQVNLIQAASDILFWDGGELANHDNGKVEGGNGVWNTGTTPGGTLNWTGTTGTPNKIWNEGKFAVFGYGSPPDLVIGGTVTVDNTYGEVTLNGAQFLVNDYVLEGGALTFTGTSGTAAILVGAGDASDSGITATINTRLTGTADLHKLHGGTLVLGGSNTYTGTTVVEGGALMLTHHAATGTGNVTLAATTALELAFGGTYANSIAGNATNTVTISGSDVTLAATDAAHTFAGAWQIVNGGTASISSESNLGAAAATVDIAAGGWLTTSDTTFSRTLSGTGVLAANLADPTGTFAFASTANATGFNGTLDLQSGYLALKSANTNVAALANATLRVSSAGVAEVLSDATIGNLTLNGGVLKIAAAPGSNINQFSGTLTVGALDLAATSTLAIGLTGTLNTAVNPHSNFFSDSGSATRFQLHVVEASSLLGSAGNITLTNYDGSAIGSPEFAQNVTINDGGISGTAVYNYRASGSNDGLYVGYGLSQLIANTGTQILLSNAGATSDTLDAALTGDGGYNFAITGTALVGNAGSDYLGTTRVTSGTVILISSTALGKTSLLDIAENAAVDLGQYSQTVTAITTASNSILNLNAGVLTITNGGTSAGALTGNNTATLILNGGLLDIRGANTGLAATATIAATGTARLDNTDGLGASGLIANAGLLEFNAAQGTLTKSIAGTGTVALANSATVTLSADNTGLDGVFSIAAGSQLIATAQNQLADAGLAIAGIFTASNTTLIELDAGNALTGDGQLVKTGSGELRITSSNAFNGTTAITGGTLTLANLHGTGTGAVSNNATLNLADTGAYANTISGSGVNLVTGNVSLRGDNTAFTGTLSVTGTADIEANTQIGATTAQVSIATNAKLATTATSFVHALSGSGVLAINTSGADFSFSSSVLQSVSPFSGTVSLTNSVLTLGTNANTDVLATAALQLDAGSALHANNETEKIKALDLNGGALWLKMNGVQPEQVLKVGTLAVNNTTASTVVFENYATGSVAMAASATNKNFLDQDNITNNATLLVEADALADSTQRKIAIKQSDDTALSNGQIVDYGNVHAIYDYTALTSSGTEAAAYTGTAGLYYDYVLTALDVQTGTTLTLTTAGATDTTLRADIIGLGSVIYTAPDGSITLSGSNTYSGTSTITTGTVIAKADNVLGAAAPLDILADGALDLDAHTQTVTAITTAAGSLLNLNSGSLAITAGGSIDGALDGDNTATLHITGGALDITGANATFAATTTIASNATARLTNPAGLGTADIALSGTLHLDIAAADSGTLQNALSGDGLFAKTNTGELTLTAASPDFSGTGVIAAGRVIATRTDNLGNAAIAIDAAATYEMRDIADGTLANTLRGTGTLALTRSNILVTRDNAIANTLAIALDQPSNLRLGVNGISLGAVHMNSGTITFATATGTATIASLGHATGHFVLNADLSAATAGNNPAGAIANALTITDAGSGRHNIYVNATGDPSVINTAIELVTVENGSAQFELSNPGGKLEHALTTFELLQGDGSVYIPDTRKWYLTDAGLSHAADAILNTASTLALDWNYSLDSLYLRMGELRSLHAAGAPSPAEGNIWMRTRAYRLNATNELSGLDFHQYAWGVSVGVDKHLPLAGGNLTLGGMLDMGNIDRTFDNSGAGDTNNIGLALYATLLLQQGWFADAVVKADRYDHEFDARARNGSTTHGEYSNKSIGLSIEAGKRLMRSDGWWYEPALQVSMLWLNSADYATLATDAQRAIDVSVNDTTNFQYRALFRAGRQIKNSAWHPYGKLAAVWVESTGGGIRAHGKKYRADYDGFRGEAGLGVMYRINEVSQVYFDYEYANASNYDRPWSFNLGYRRLW